MRFEQDNVAIEKTRENGEVVDQDSEPYNQHWHDDGWVLEVGATYTFRERIGLPVAYKYQELKRSGSLGDVADTADMEFSGVTFGIDYRF